MTVAGAFLNDADARIVFGVERIETDVTAGAGMQGAAAARLTGLDGEIAAGGKDEITAGGELRRVQRGVIKLACRPALPFNLCLK